MKNNNHVYGRERRLVYHEKPDLSKEMKNQQDPNAKFYAIYQEYSRQKNDNREIAPKDILEKYKQALEEVIPYYIQRQHWVLSHARYTEYRQLFGENQQLAEEMAKGGEEIQKLERDERGRSPEEYLQGIVRGLPFSVIRASESPRLYTASSFLYPLPDGIQKNAREWWKMNPTIEVDIDITNERIRKVSILSERPAKEWEGTRVQEVVKTFTEGRDATANGSLQERLRNLTEQLHNAFEWQFASYEETKKTPKERKEERQQRFDRLARQHERMNDILGKFQGYKNKKESEFLRALAALKSMEHRAETILNIPVESEEGLNIPELRSSRFQRDIDEVMNSVEDYLFIFAVEEFERAIKTAQILPLNTEARLTPYRSAGIRNGKVVNNIPVYESRECQSAPEKYGYTIYLQRLLQETLMNSEVRKAVLWDACLAIAANLYRLEQAMEHSYEHTLTRDRAHNMLREEYKRFAEMLMDINGKSTDLLEISRSMARPHIERAIASMQPDEIYSWVKYMGDTVNDRGVLDEQPQFFQYCGEAIADRLLVLQGKGNLDKVAYQRQCLRFGQLFRTTGKREISATAKFTSEFDIPRGPRRDLSRVGNSGIAGHFLEQACDYHMLASRYYEYVLQEQHPLAKELVRWPSVKKNFQALLSQKNLSYANFLQNNPSLANTITLIENDPKTIEGIGVQYAAFRQTENFVQQLPNVLSQQSSEIAKNATPTIQLLGLQTLQSELSEKMKPYLENAHKAFSTFLDGTWAMGAPGEQKVQDTLGVAFSPIQIDAFRILRDMRGDGYDLSDAMEQLTSQITTMLLVGIIVGIATSGLGLGVIASSLMTGEALTGMQYIMDNRRFKTVKEAFDYYGQEFLVNTASGGIGHLARGGRYALQLSRVTRESAPRIFATCMRGRGMASVG